MDFSKLVSTKRKEGEKKTHCVHYGPKTNEHELIFSTRIDIFVVDVSWLQIHNNGVLLTNFLVI